MATNVNQPNVIIVISSEIEPIYEPDILFGKSLIVSDQPTEIMSNQPTEIMSNQPTEIIWKEESQTTSGDYEDVTHVIHVKPKPKNETHIRIHNNNPINRMSCYVSHATIFFVMWCIIFGSFSIIQLVFALKYGSNCRTGTHNWLIVNSVLNFIWALIIYYVLQKSNKDNHRTDGCVLELLSLSIIVMFFVTIVGIIYVPTNECTDINYNQLMKACISIDGIVIVLCLIGLRNLLKNG